MTTEDKFAYCEELYGRMKIAEKEAAGIKTMQVEEPGLYFVHIGDKEYVNPQLLPFEKHFMIVQFGEFIRLHNNLRYQDVLKILNQNESMFSFLLDVLDVMPNIVEEARRNHDEKFLSYMYWGLKNQTVNKNL